MSYLDIISRCKLLDYTEGIQRIETWLDPIIDRVYQCIWLSQNEGKLPTTITYNTL